MMAGCRGTGCRVAPRHLVRLRSREGGIHDELRLCPAHYEEITAMIAKLAPGAEQQVAGYESAQSQAVH